MCGQPYACCLISPKTKISEQRGGERIGFIFSFKAASYMRHHNLCVWNPAHYKLIGRYEEEITMYDFLSRIERECVYLSAREDKAPKTRYNSETANTMQTMDQAPKLSTCCRQLRSYHRMTFPLLLWLVSQACALKEHRNADIRRRSIYTQRAELIN